MKILSGAVLALLLAATPVASQPAPAPELGGDELGEWVRVWAREQHAATRQIETELKQEEVGARQMRDYLRRIRADAAAQRTVLALGDLRPNDFARAVRNWNAWKRVAQEHLSQAKAVGQAAADRKQEQEERWELLGEEEAADLGPATASALRQARSAHDQAMKLLDRLAHLAEMEAQDAKAGITVCKDVVAVLERTFARLSARFFVQRVDFLDGSAALAGLRKDWEAILDPLAEWQAVESRDRLLAGLRENAPALATGLILVALAFWRVRRVARRMESAAGEISDRLPGVLRRSAAALLLALSRTAGLAVVAGITVLLDLVLGTSRPGGVEALSEILRALFAWRLLIAFLRVTLGPEAAAFRLLPANAPAAALARLRLERLALWLFVGLVSSTIVAYVGFASWPLMLLMLGLQVLALRSVARSLRDDRLATLGLPPGWCSAARQWRAVVQVLTVVALAMAGLGYVNLGWYTAWGFFKLNIVLLGVLLLWRLGAEGVEESLAEAEFAARRTLRRLWAAGLFVLVIAGLPRVLGVGATVWHWLGEALAYSLPVGERTLTVGSILTAVLCVLSAWVLGRLINAVLTRRIFPHSVVDAGVRAAITTTVDYVLVTVGVLLGIRALGFDLTSLAIVAGALSVGIGFGMQTLVSNFVSGLIILYERPFRPGDILEHEGLMGSVKKIRTRSTIMQTFDEAELIVPNSDLLAKRITNWTLSNYRTRSHIPVGVAYGSDVELVRDTLLEVAAAHPRLVDEPKVFFTGFGESALEFKLLIWCDIRERLQVVSDVHFAIDRAFRERGIEIPFPQRDIHVRTVSSG